MKLALAESFRLERGGPKRLRVGFEPGAPNIKVCLDGVVVATVALEAAKSGPVRIETPVGVLTIQLKPGYSLSNWVLSINGIPVPGAQNDPTAMIRFGAGAGLFLGLIGVASGVLRREPIIVVISVLLVAGSVGAFRRIWLAAWLATLLSVLVPISIGMDYHLSSEGLMACFLFGVIAHTAVRGIDASRKASQALLERDRSGSD